MEEMVMGSLEMAMVRGIRSNKLSARIEQSGHYYLLSDRQIRQSELFELSIAGRFSANVIFR